MKVLVTGRGTSGSFQIRGVQLGHAIGADVEPDAAHVEGYDIAILVKRTTGNLIDRLHGARVPIVYDVLDGWRQPEGNDCGRDECMQWLDCRVRAIRPAAIVAATDAMRRDCEGFGLPVLWLPHHARPGMSINQIRQEVKTVGYEGGINYVGRWRPILERECSRRGWKFVTNPEQLADVDIVVAVREATGYAPRHWKSCVKMSNAMGSGTPIIANREAGSVEIDNGGEVWADTEQEMRDALDSLTGHHERLAASEKLRAGVITLERVARDYKAWLKSLLKS